MGLTDWMERASCVGWEPELFFDGYLNDDKIAMDVANLCLHCPVQLQCFNYGVIMKSVGVWGGHWLQNGQIAKNKELVLTDYYEEA